MYIILKGSASTRRKPRKLDFQKNKNKFRFWGYISQINIVKHPQAVIKA